MDILERYRILPFIIMLSVIAVSGLTGDTSSEQFDRTEISILPSSYQVEPGSTFKAEVRILPVVPVSGLQFDLCYPEKSLSITDVSEGDLFSKNNIPVIFELVDNSETPVGETIYCAVLGNRSMDDPGTVAFLTIKAGKGTGYVNMDIEDVILSDTLSDPLSYNINPATILIDSGPVLEDTGNIQFLENDTLNMTLKATDADNDELIFSCKPLPEGASLDRSTGTFIWTPDTGQKGEHYIEFTVSDGYLTDKGSCIITVLCDDEPPIAYVNGPYGTRTGKKLKFSSTGSHDPDGNIMSYTWDFGDGSMGIGPDPLHTYRRSGQYTVTLTVTDDAGNTDTCMTTVNVERFFRFYLGRFR